MTWSSNEIACTTVMATCVIMIVLYAVVLYHIWNGSKNEWAIKVTGTLLVSEVAYLCYGFEYYKLRV